MACELYRRASDMVRIDAAKLMDAPAISSGMDTCAQWVEFASSTSGFCASTAFSKERTASCHAPSDKHKGACNAATLVGLRWTAALTTCRAGYGRRHPSSASNTATTSGTKRAVCSSMVCCSGGPNTVTVAGRPGSLPAARRKHSMLVTADERSAAKMSQRPSVSKASFNTLSKGCSSRFETAMQKPVMQVGAHCLP